MSRQSKLNADSKPELTNHSNGASSDAAKLYLPSLARLLDLSPELDAVLRVGPWKNAAIRVHRILSEEEDRLVLINSAVQNFIDCRGGQTAIVAQAKRDAEIETIDQEKFIEAATRTAKEQLAYVALERHRVYGMNVDHFRLSEEEKRVLDESCATPERDRQVQPESDASTLATTVPSPISVLTRLLAEPRPDLIAVQRELGRVSEEILNRTAALAGHHANDIAQCRILTARALESKRAQLVRLASAGIIRCFGGKSRLALEAKLRSDKEVPPDDDPIYAIAERIVKDMEAGKYKDQQPGSLDQAS